MENLGRYDRALRERIDGMLQRRARICGNVFTLIVLWGAWRAGLPLLPIVAISAAFGLFAAVLSRKTFGMMDRRLANRGFFIGNSAYALGLMYACRFSPYVVFVIPLVILFFDGFGEGDTRPFVVAMLVIFALVPLALGSPPVRIVAAIGMGAVIHWFSEGRASTLRMALGELRSKAAELHEVNLRVRDVCSELEARTAELTANCDTLRATRDRLIQSEKLAAIGQLAAGLSHEINNPLAVILGFAQGLERRLDDGSAHHLPVTSIVREALRCKSLVQELLTFSRTGRNNVEPVDLNALLRETVPLLETKAGLQGTRVDLELGPGSFEIVANRTQLQQVIINLGNNALDAVENGGAVKLRSRYRTEAVTLEVEDTGPGIPETIRGNVFDAFFTTKEVGKGTGLGLSLVHEIVHQHGGSIEVVDRQGRGTTMRVSMPAIRTQQAPSGSDLPRLVAAR